MHLIYSLRLVVNIITHALFVITSMNDQKEVIKVGDTASPSTQSKPVNNYYHNSGVQLRIYPVVLNFIKLFPGARGGRVSYSLTN